MIDPIIFKHEFSLHGHWWSYGLAIGLLLVMIIILAKKHKPASLSKTACTLIEKKLLSHKTIVYIVEYQQQRFLLADNQQALAIHPLTQEGSDETV